MPETMSPREKVARIIDPRGWALVDHWRSLWGRPDLSSRITSEKAPSLRKADAILAALASSGDHAELARAIGRLLPITILDTPDYAEVSFGECQAQAMTMEPDTWLALNQLPALIAEVAALRASASVIEPELGDLQATNADLSAHLSEAERKLDEADAALKEIAQIEPQPFDGGLDMEAIRACDECQRYAGHPVQQGICNTHRRPLWDREKHERHEEKALGYRAKSIARTFLSKDAER